MAPNSSSVESGIPVYAKGRNQPMATHPLSIITSAFSTSEVTCLNSRIGCSARTERSGGIFSGQSILGGVLVIVNEPDIRTVIRLILEKAGYSVVEAEDGEHAIQVINDGEHPMVIDVIIMDIRMPRINGLEARPYFQREYPSVALIMLTGFQIWRWPYSF